MRAHQHAFAAFGGVRKVIRPDNLGAAVVRACLYDPDVSEIYAAFTQYWGFVSFPSRPKSPQEQGVKERAGGYVKSNALRGRRFDDLAALNAHLQKWNRLYGLWGPLVGAHRPVPIFRRCRNLANRP